MAYVETLSCGAFSDEPPSSSAMLSFHIQLLNFTNSRRQRYVGAFSTELRVTKCAQFAFAKAAFGCLP